MERSTTRPAELLFGDRVVHLAGIAGETGELAHVMARRREGPRGGPGIVGALTKPPPDGSTAPIAAYLACRTPCSGCSHLQNLGEAAPP
jgi:hypothetical protein